MYFNFSSFVYFDANKIEMSMAADSPKRVLGRAEFWRLVTPAGELMEEMSAPAMLNAGQLMKAITTPMNPNV